MFGVGVTNPEWLDEMRKRCQQPMKDQQNVVLDIDDSLDQQNVVLDIDDSLDQQNVVLDIDDSLLYRNVHVLYILEPASVLHWLLHRCEVTPILTGVYVIGLRNCEVFMYWRGVTQGVSNKALLNDKLIAKNPAYLESYFRRFNLDVAEKRGSCKGYTGTSYKNAIAPTCRALNWRVLMALSAVNILGACMRVSSKKQGFQTLCAAFRAPDRPDLSTSFTQRVRPGARYVWVRRAPPAQLLRVSWSWLRSLLVGSSARLGRFTSHQTNPPTSVEGKGTPLCPLYRLHVISAFGNSSLSSRKKMKFEFGDQIWLYLNNGIPPRDELANVTQWWGRFLREFCPRQAFTDRVLKTRAPAAAIAELVSRRDLEGLSLPVATLTTRHTLLSSTGQSACSTRRSLLLRRRVFERAFGNSP
ncbi:hypothetical protein PR048_031094 [Dryococelus australis]|uniref:Uncharacterized protein n=1 Tax=Dryococelus australis TaxID=614101 RepID=A0ABQ9G4A3_9NEOP|nr:hypothetical protein PR048_031094 [Dryococelus australis]